MVLTLIKKRETKIQFYFGNETEVHIAKEQDELDSLTETFKLRSQEDIIDNWIDLLLWMMFLM